MKNKEQKMLEVKLLAGIQKVIKANKATLTKKAEKLLKKVSKQVAKKSHKMMVSTSK